jgi:hypothetical protein
VFLASVRPGVKTPVPPKKKKKKKGRGAYLEFQIPALGWLRQEDLSNEVDLVLPRKTLHRVTSFQKTNRSWGCQSDSNGRAPA